MRKPAVFAVSLILGLSSTSLAATEITFLYGLGGPLGQGILEMIADFNKSQNDVVVRGEFGNNYEGVQQKALAGIAAGTPAADILQLEVSLVTRLADAGALVDLKRMPGFQQHYNSLWSVFKKQVTRPDGGIYASPWNNSVPVLYFNPTLLAKAGLKSSPRTWAEMRTAARRIKAATGVPAVNIPDTTWLLEAALWSNGNLPMIKNGRLQLDQPAALEVINLWASMVREGSAVMDSSSAATEFAAGRLAMRFASVATRTELNQTANFKFGTGPVPYFKKPVVTVGGAALGIPKGLPADRQAAAWRFIRWLNEPAQQVQWIRKSNYLPISRPTIDTAAFKSFVGTSSGLDMGYRQLTLAQPRPTAPNYSQGNTEIQKALQDIYQRNAPVAATMRNLVQRTAPLFRDVR